MDPSNVPPPLEARRYIVDEKRPLSSQSWEKNDYRLQVDELKPNTLLPAFNPNIAPSKGSERIRAMSLESGSYDMKGGLSHNSHGHNPLHELVSGIRPPLPFGQRLRHFTLAWYTLTMATGGVATLISVQPHAFPGLISVGAFFYILNLIFFSSLNVLMLLRWVKHPGTMKEALKHNREGLFVGPFWLSCATIITGTQKYVVQALEADHAMRPWLTTSIAIAFWAYTAATFLSAVFQYSYLFHTHMYVLDKFMPSWLLPIFPIMLAGTIAAVIAGDQPLASRYPILFAGISCQGLGYTVCLLWYAHWIGRLITAGWPNPEHRPALYIGVGPPSFTALALLGMANAIPPELNLLDPSIQMAPFFTGAMLRVLATVAACSLWLLALWFFCIATIATLVKRPKLFHLGWWAMVFPNSGFTIATISIGNAVNSEGLRYLGNGMTIGIILMWLFVVYMNFRAVIVRDIMWPGMDEDVDD